ncbi:hypothetical protein BCF11_4870 [Collimonas sp. PA-H2]|uniref:hypothetical protein n=1 Tax=Collimonas sp. PA-H2 TaxID=1881062 RepID=UPI000C019BBD|nr:hypothetical protein [Collimonas sp. PA-H2]PFH12389.1 hypothetical protein BCF11_4870 [Collimonas sp. PA-H2]
MKYLYFPDSDRGLNKTEVFVSMPISQDILSVHEAVRYLRDNFPSPLHLKMTSQKGMTVKLKVIANPQFSFGRELPQENSQLDIDEILSVLTSNGLPAKIICESN